MNISTCSNIWQHPRTSIAGILIGIITIVGVLANQQIVSWADLWHALTAYPFVLIGALATALLGLVSRDWTDSPSGSQTTLKCGIWALVLLLVLPGMIVPMVGCTVTSDQLKSDAAALASALSSLSSAEITSDPTTAASLETASEGLTAIVNNWNTSTSAGLLSTAAAGAEAILANIPSASKYTTLVAIAVAALDAILANTSTKAQLEARARVGSPTMSASLVEYRQQGRLMIHHRLGRSAEGDFKYAWNKAVRDGNFALQPIR